MRIISGELKGRTIKYLKNINTRPLKDLVRENIFNILNHSKFVKVKLKNSKILDLYSGVGSFGIECISRGAKKVIFIEHDDKASNILKENLINLSIFNRSFIYTNKIENTLINKIEEKFNIFFLDPPYKKFDYLRDLEIIKKKKIYSQNHIVVIHREKKSIDKFDNILDVIETKRYGRSKIIFGVIN